MNARLSAMDDNGKPVDWWFAYKVSERSEPQGAAKGNEYLYYDANSARAGAPMKLSTLRMDAQEGALFSTLRAIYESTHIAPNTGWFCYNDENPAITQPYTNPVNQRALDPTFTMFDHGHAKGVLAFDTATDSAFWLVHSMPKFPWPEGFVFPSNCYVMAQTFLCVSLPSVAVARSIATQMLNCQQPNVYAASPLPTGLQSDDPLARMMAGSWQEPPAYLKSIIPFASHGGQRFQVMAKNPQWGQSNEPKLDFYNDLVAPALKEDLDVETWENDPTPKATDAFSRLKVVSMNSVDLKALGSALSWSEADDHAKLAVSAPSEKMKWVCVGDINFTIAQEARGGGTVGFICDPLWQELNRILSLTVIPSDHNKPAGFAKVPGKGGKSSSPSASTSSAKPAKGSNAKARRTKPAKKNTSTGKTARKKPALKKAASKKSAHRKPAAKKARVLKKKAAAKKVKAVKKVRAVRKKPTAKKTKAVKKAKPVKRKVAAKKQVKRR